MTLLILVSLAVAAGYLVSLRVHPYRKCRHCGGNGRHESKSGVLYGNCWWCRDKRLIRAGVRVFLPKTHAEIRAGRHGRFY